MNTNKNSATSTNSNQWNSTTSWSSPNTGAPHIEKVILPTERIEQPTAIHEQIRHEKVKEVQPIYDIERVQTEVHQKTQPLLDKEIKPVSVSHTTRNTEVLPELVLNNRSLPATRDVSTAKVEESSVVVEKPAVFHEVDKKKVIEEIQPVIYKETIVPSIVQETKPVYQKVVEGPHYSQQTLPAQTTSNFNAKVDFANVPRESFHSERIQENLATEVRELPASIHESIRQEKVTEIQPIVNIEKNKTEVIQKTQPIFDKEIRPVAVEHRTKDINVLPEIHLQDKGQAWSRDVSTVNLEGTVAATVEKPAIYNETEKLKIVEEVQPVIYKETVIPEVLQETRPVFQKIVEGTVYSHETLPPKMLHSTGFSYPTNPTIIDRATTVPLQATSVPVHHHSLPHKPLHTSGDKFGSHPKLMEETTTTTTTTTTSAAPSVNRI